MILNIAETFIDVAKRYGERIALIEAQTGNRVSFDELNRTSDAYADLFASKGLKPGDITILMVRPSITFVCLTLALFKVGIPVLLIDPGMGYRNILRSIRKIVPKALVGSRKALWFAKLFPKAFSTVKRRFCCGSSLGLLGEDIIAKCIPTNQKPYPVYSPLATDLAAIIFTTGSTGPPKGVCYGHSIFSAQLRLFKKYYDIGPGDIDQPAFPLFALFSAALGVCSVIPDMDSSRPARVDPKKFVSSIMRYGVTYSFGSPAIWNVVSKYCLDKKMVLKSMQKILMAGAPVPCELLKRVTGILRPDALVYTPYGATEGLPITCIEAREVITKTWEQTRSGDGTCVGRVLPGIEIKIIMISDNTVADLSKDMFLATGEIGEIIVRGDVVTKGYLNDPAETIMTKIKDGGTFWHRMGDLGYLDSQERLWFCGRKAHMVKTEAGILFSVLCEAITNEHPTVYRSALVGVKKRVSDGVEIPVIIVEPHGKKNISTKQLLKEIRKLAKNSRLTRDIDHFMIHKNFPVDIRHNAKIFREKLALWAQKKIFLRR